LGADTGISKSEVADLRGPRRGGRCVPDRSLSEVAYPYVFLDATYCKARVNRRVVSQAVVIATGVTADGRREVLGFDVGDSMDGAFWTAFLRSSKARGLGGVQLVISGAHTGLKAAIASAFISAAWQRCRVHFMRNVLAVVPKGNQEMVAAAIQSDAGVFVGLTPQI
jgi:putative transposase